MSPDASRRARVTDGPPSPWTNRHQNVEQPFDRLYHVANPPGTGLDFFGDLKLTVSALQGLIADAIRDGKSLRAIGGGWSLSNAAVTDGRMVETARLNWALPIGAGDVLETYPGDPSRLVYLQCGVSVDEANRTLAGLSPALALKTSGASNGQTIAGAVSTGTHGSRFRFGSMPDYVTGIHLITGPDSAIWLESKSDPVISDALAAKLGASIVRGDTLFRSALVSFGSFGIIHGLMIEAEPLYLLELWRQKVKIDDAGLRLAMRELDFSGLKTPHPGKEPFHFEVVVNPHDTKGGAYVTTMYVPEPSYRDDYDRPIVKPGGLGPGDDVLGLMGALGDKIPQAVGPLVTSAVSSQYKLYKGQLGTPGEIFDSNMTFQKELSAEIGVALEDTLRVLDLMLAAPERKGYPGLLAFRWVKQSKALLAFTKFDTTCAIELPGAYADRTSAYYNAIWNSLEAAGIPYTLHWGQVNNFTPQRVRQMYGDAAVDTWLASRNTLLAPEVRAVFSSPFLRECGLG
jgi:hypothetical protein